MLPNEIIHRMTGNNHQVYWYMGIYLRSGSLDQCVARSLKIRSLPPPYARLFTQAAKRRFFEVNRQKLFKRMSLAAKYLMGLRRTKEMLSDA